MEVKTSTKEKFTVIYGMPAELTANLADELVKSLTSYLAQPVKNLVLNLEGLQTVEETAAERLVQLQQHFYEQQASFVICCLDARLEEQLDKMNLLELMNVTPTESEAWDIVQMEEIERELLDGEDF